MSTPLATESDTLLRFASASDTERPGIAVAESSAARPNPGSVLTGALFSKVADRFLANSEVA